MYIELNDEEINNLINGEEIDCGYLNQVTLIVRRLPVVEDETIK